MAIYQNGSLQEQTIYGSSRLGIYQGKGTQGKRSVGFKAYEISNHLGNVLSTVSDLRCPYLYFTKYQKIPSTKRFRRLWTGFSIFFFYAKIQKFCWKNKAIFGLTFYFWE